MSHPAHPGEAGKDEVAAFTLAPSKTPKTINFTVAEGTDKGTKLAAIYALDGDSLKLCISAPGEKRPTEFRGGKTAQLLEFKGEKK